MERSDLLRTIEFLTLFFSIPEKPFFEEIYAGRTPLGEVADGEPFDEFYTTLVTEMTLLLVNSPNERPVYPLATTYIDEHTEREQYIDRLGSWYQSAGKVVISRPLDHITVLLEFLYSLLQDEQLPEAQKFYEQFIENWTNRFSTAILKREPSKCMSRVVQLIDQLGEQVNSVCGYGYAQQ